MMAESIEYRAEFNIMDYVDETAKRIQDEVDQAALDKAAATLAKFGYVKADGKSRWFELFGTPERAARTLCDVVSCVETANDCDACEFSSLCARTDDYDALLEWLRGDAE